MKLGDAVANVTKKLGIEPCDSCKKRQEWLNNAHDWFADVLSLKEKEIFDVVTVYDDAGAPPSITRYADEDKAVALFQRQRGASHIRSVSVRENGRLRKFWSKDDCES